MKRSIIITASFVAALAWTAAAAETEDQPPGPFKESFSTRKDPRPGWMLLSDDTVLEGVIFSTRGRPLTIFNREEKEYARLEWGRIARIDVAIETDVLEQDWRWKEGGSDVKVYTDFFYIWHRYLTTISLKDGEKITGDISAPVYIIPDGEEKRRRFILHRRNKGEKAERETVAPPVYIKKLVLTDLDGAEQPPQPEEEKQPEEEEQQDQLKQEGE